MKLTSYFIAGVMAITALTGCSNSNSESSGGKKIGFYQALLAQLGQSTTQAVISEDGQPIAGAQILIGQAVGAPFASNLVTTDSKGQFSAPADWTTSQPVTISAPGFLRATYLAQLPTGQKFSLRQTKTHGSFEVTGQTPGINVVAGDGNAYFSLVMPVLQKADLLHFNIGMVMSPQSDQISVIGQTVNVPSNITLPYQKQSYFLPFTLNKPIFRSYFDTTGPKRMMALSGRFPFKKVVDELRSHSEPTYMVANDMEITSAGLAVANITGATTNLDIPVTQIQIDSARSVYAGSVANNEVLVGVSITESNGDLVPTDVKILNPGTSNNLRVQSSGTAAVLSVLKRQNEMSIGPGDDRLSAVLMPFTNGVQPQHLPLMNNPQLSSNSKLQLQKINLPSGLQALATYGSLQSVQTTILADGSKQETLTQVWEVYAPDWTDVIEIPTWPGESAPGTGMRWSAAYLAGAQKASLDLGPALMQSVTHVTNASVDF